MTTDAVDTKWILETVIINNEVDMSVGCGAQGCNIIYGGHVQKVRSLRWFGCGCRRQAG